MNRNHGAPPPPPKYNIAPTPPTDDEQYEWLKRNAVERALEYLKVTDEYIRDEGVFVLAGWIRMAGLPAYIRDDAPGRTIAVFGKSMNNPTEPLRWMILNKPGPEYNVYVGEESIIRVRAIDHN
ncbi:hypothetical protein AURDEDRAFT_178027 [Auricularia subglabra TFB-10046 SS5]|uniref:Uncharacterized protein n=1 Tax=Auricularia subglabra (strain TFB-10046 / SS5) TaxID=717982 RepID=J0CRJ1_AURST|nr:hypothetical protein AURDEDRAFT_178027 [Auricularia subglabra TFB-10046 SS5]